MSMQHRQTHPPIHPHITVALSHVEKGAMCVDLLVSGKVLNIAGAIARCGPLGARRVHFGACRALDLLNVLKEKANHLKKKAFKGFSRKWVYIVRILGLCAKQNKGNNG